MDINEILNIAPYSLDKEQKHQLLNDRLHDLTLHHYERCPEYKRMVDA